MENRETAGAFLRSRRERITPPQAGLPTYGRRRVPGLRRSEVAALAGVSVEYYTRLERGSLGGVSDSVLDALARALRLDATERTYLYDLARTARPSPAARSLRPEARQPDDRRTEPRRTEGRHAVRPSVARIVEGMPGLPAYVMTNRLDALVANRLGRALYAEMFADATCGSNVARFAFLNPAAKRFYIDWERMAGFAVGALRAETAKSPADRELSDLVDELSTRSDEFRAMWNSHDVYAFRESTKRLNHPDVGDLELDQETMNLPGPDGLSVVVYSAPPGSTAEEKLRRLAGGQVNDAPGAVRSRPGP